MIKFTGPLAVGSTALYQNAGSAQTQAPLPEKQKANKPSPNQNAKKGNSTGSSQTKDNKEPNRKSQDWSEWAASGAKGAYQLLCDNYFSILTALGSFAAGLIGSAIRYESKIAGLEKHNEVLNEENVALRRAANLLFFSNLEDGDSLDNNKTDEQPLEEPSVEANDTNININI